MQAAEAITHLRREVSQCLGLISDASFEQKYKSHVGQDSIWNYLAWAEWEWRYGWPEAIAANLADLMVAVRSPREGIFSLLDFGSGLGEVPLYLFRRMGIVPTLADRPGLWREVLSWRCGQRNLPKPIEAEDVWLTSKWDVVMALEVLEHVRDGKSVLQGLASQARYAVILSGAMGRPESDKDPLHIYKEPLAPQLLEQGFSLWRGGGALWVFVRTEVAKRYGLQLIDLTGKAI